jgi:microcystin-dependent protein
VFGLINRDTLPAATADEFEHFTSQMKGLWLREHNEDGTHKVLQTFDSVPMGGILPYAGATAPSSRWLICDGSQVSRVTYQNLFNLIGTTYGAGDGSTTFNIPNLQQRFPLGKAAAGTGSTLGSTGGAIDHSHSLSGLSISGNTGSASPGTDTQGSHSHGGATGGHTHTFSGTTGDDNDAGITANLAGATVTLAFKPHQHAFSGTTDSATATISSDGAHSHTVNSHSHSAGSLAVSGTEGSANPPYLVINFIILAQ